MKRLVRSSIISLFAFLVLFLLAPSVQAQNKLYRYTHMGNQQFHRANTKNAGSYYLQVLKQQPTNARALFNLADVYLSGGDVHSADSLYTKVTQLETNKQISAMAWHNRGYISQKAALQSRDKQQELLKTAIEQYKQSLRLNPHDERTRYNLALCQKQLKDAPPQNDKNQNKQQNQQQKQQDQQKDKQNQQQNKNQQQNQQKQEQDKQQERQQTEQYMNLARQAERRALERLKQHQPQQRSKGKNW